ncbi:MAG: hypothetical protein JW891_10155 [Candidatus Lokiarchaeota archaeon]|nr:hypothetical protein [Candidatus Lokiarchaeota archaeon]
MTIVLIPVAPLSRSKSRLENCLSRENLINLTLAMLEDMLITLTEVNKFKEIVVFGQDQETLDLAENFGCVGFKEDKKNHQRSFDEIIKTMNQIAITELDARATLIAFLDLVLISKRNFYDILKLMNKNRMVVCPAIQSMGISVLGRVPPNIIEPTFCSPNTTSLKSLLTEAKKKGIEDVAIYDSFRASFDVDIESDLLMAYEYLKMFNLKEKKTYLFLKNNLNSSLQKINGSNNRKFQVTKKYD